jgi:hypothetical protein
MYTKFDIYVISTIFSLHMYGWLSSSHSKTFATARHNGLNPAQTRCNRFNIMWESLSVTCGRSVVSPGTPVFSTNKTDRQDIPEILFKSGVKRNYRNPNRHNGEKTQDFYSEHTSQACDPPLLINHWLTLGYSVSWLGSNIEIAVNVAVTVILPVSMVTPAWIPVEININIT